MIVFYYLISFILIIILSLIVVMLFSSITLEVKKIKIDEKNLATIVNHVLDKKYTQILDNIEIIFMLKINVFNLIPINIMSIDNKKIKQLLEKNKGKIQITKNKEISKMIISDLINNYLQINKIDIDISLGLHNAHSTALISTLFMIILAISLNIVTDDRIKIYKDEKKQENYIRKNFKFKVNPIYGDKIVFKFDFYCKITIKIISTIKEILMYKSNLFVNNTNKYRVKEN